jgi:hypothetical protein
MNSIIKLSSLRSAPRLRLPAHPMAVLADASFKPEHLSEILAARIERAWFDACEATDSTTLASRRA